MAKFAVLERLVSPIIIGMNILQLDFIIFFSFIFVLSLLMTFSEIVRFGY